MSETLGAIFHSGALYLILNQNFMNVEIPLRGYLAEIRHKELAQVKILASEVDLKDNAVRIFILSFVSNKSGKL